jgi:hypothetical protein
MKAHHRIWFDEGIEVSLESSKDGLLMRWRPARGYHPVGVRVDALETVLLSARIPQLLGFSLRGITVTTPVLVPPAPWLEPVQLRRGRGWSVHVPSALLDLPVRNSAIVREALDAAVARVSEDRRTPVDLVDRVRGALQHRPHSMTLAEVAQQLHTTPPRNSAQRQQLRGGDDRRAPSNWNGLGAGYTALATGNSEVAPAILDLTSYSSNFYGQLGIGLQRTATNGARGTLHAVAALTGE